MSWLFYLYAAILGLILGSFFNVAIYRLPRNETLGQRSRCPGCGAPIHWYDNIPLVSFIVLRGRCRSCGTRISWRYPLVELTTALLFVLVYWWSITIVPGDLHIPGGAHFVPEVLIGILLVSILIIAKGADITSGIVPNRAMYPGLVLMLLLVTALALYRGQPGRIGLAVATGAIGGGFLLVAGLIYGALFMRRAPATVSETDDMALSEGAVPERVEEIEGEEDEGLPTGIGMGDVKLAAFFGMALGYFHLDLIVVALFLGFLVGALGSLFFILFSGKGRKDRLPFAPFLATGALLALIWGQRLVDAYIRLVRH